MKLGMWDLDNYNVFDHFPKGKGEMNIPRVGNQIIYFYFYFYMYVGVVRVPVAIVP